MSRPDGVKDSAPAVGELNPQVKAAPFFRHPCRLVYAPLRHDVYHDEPKSIRLFLKCTWLQVRLTLLQTIFYQSNKFFNFPQTKASLRLKRSTPFAIINAPPTPAPGPSSFLPCHTDHLHSSPPPASPSPLHKRNPVRRMLAALRLAS